MFSTLSKNFFISVSSLVLVVLLIFLSFPFATVSATSDNDAAEDDSTDVLYEARVDDTDEVSVCRRKWPSNADRSGCFVAKNQKDDHGNLKRSFVFRKNFKSNMSNTDDEPLTITISSGISSTPLNRYNDVRLVIDYFSCFSHTSLMKTDGLQIFVTDSNGHRHGPFGLYYWEFTGLYERSSLSQSDYKYYERNFNLISDTISIDDGAAISQIDILPYGNYPQYINTDVTFTGDWRGTGDFNFSGVKLVGYKDSVYEKPSYVETDTIGETEEEELRTEIVQEMYNEATYKWTPDKEARDVRTLGDTERIVARYIPGVSYYGLPYTQRNRVTLDVFDGLCETTSDSPLTHVLHVPDDMNRLPGQDCSYSVSFAQGKYCGDMVGTDCVSRAFDSHLVTPLGNLTLSGTKRSTKIVPPSAFLNGGSSDVVFDSFDYKPGTNEYYTAQDLFEAYAELKPADTISSHTSNYSHVRMASGYPHVVRDESGNIDGEASYVICTDIAISTAGPEASVSDEYRLSSTDVIVPFTPNPDYTDISSLDDLSGVTKCFNVNRKVSFQKLLNTDFVPARLNVFVNKERDLPFIEVLQPNTIDDIRDGLKGTVYSNYPLSEIKYELVDCATGKTETITEYPEHSKGSLESGFVGIYSLCFNAETSTKDKITDFLDRVHDFRLKISAHAGDIEKTVVDISTINADVPLEAAVKATMDAYYNRGIDLQYCTARKTNYMAPEQATSQYMMHTVCSGFTFLEYYNGLGISIPFSVQNMLAYAKAYYDPSAVDANGVVEYWERQNSKSFAFYDNEGNEKTVSPYHENGNISDDIVAYGNYLLNDVGLRPGDVICWSHGKETSGPGHTCMVYDLVRDENNNVVDALIRESGSNYDKNTTKIRDGESSFVGLSYAERNNSVTGIVEGTITERNLIYYRYGSERRPPALYSCRNMNSFAILRPVLRDESGNPTYQYYATEYKDDDNSIYGCVCTDRTLTDITIPAPTMSRLRYEDIYIEKTVNKAADGYNYNRGVVPPGDSLTYSLLIENRGKSTYRPFVVREKIPLWSSLESAPNASVSDNEAVWDVNDELSPGERLTLTFTVRVSNRVEYCGKKVISEGYVDNIATSTVETTIGYNLNDEQKQSLLSRMTTLLHDSQFGGLSGADFVEDIYDKGLSFSPGLADYDIDDLVKQRMRHHFWYADKKKSSIYLNEDNSYFDMLLPGYYGGLFIRERADGSLLQRLKTYEQPSRLGERTDRAPNIRSDNFQTGDILVYRNEQTAKKAYPSESGFYYFMYVEEDDKITVNGEELFGFIGIKEEKKDGESVKSIYRLFGDLSPKINSANELKVLFGKDVFTVLRPSLRLNKTGTDTTAPSVVVSYSLDVYTIDPVDVTIDVDETVQPVEGWVLSNDGTRLTKRFHENGQETVVLFDEAGNRTEANVSVSNIVELIMPDTGGMGSASYYIIAFVSLLCCLSFVIFIRKRIL